MNESNIFITGSSGQLGTALRKQYPNAQFADLDKLDITDKKSVESFDWSGIKILLNAAAYTNVDGAETEEGRRLAWAVNADAVANLVSVSAHYDMTLVHVSTDYVFDGTRNNHSEDEVFAPLSVYGASKASGDIAISLAPKFYIIRTSWVIGEGKNFVRTMIDLAEKNVSPTVVHDQVGRLTFTSELVRAIHHLINSQIADSRNQKNAGLKKEKLLTDETREMKNIFPFGTYNVTNSGSPASWADITREIFTLIGRDDLKVTNTTTAEYYAGKEGIAPRPLKSTLSLDKIKSTGFESKEWQEELKIYIDQLTSSN